MILNAQINPDGAATEYHFEYDTTPYTSTATHGTSITEEGENTEVNIGSGTSAVSVEVKLKDLTPGATYYYRVLATNSQSPAGGTPALAKPSPPRPPRAQNPRRNAPKTNSAAPNSPSPRRCRTAARMRWSRR